MQSEEYYQRIIHCYDDEKRQQLVRNYLDQVAVNRDTIRKIWFRTIRALCKDEITNAQFRKQMREISELRRIYG